MFEKVYDVICAEELKNQLPADGEIRRIKAENDRILKDIISGRDKRFLVVSGPCSADSRDALYEYCKRLSVLKEKFSDRMFILPRVFTAKPRTTGEGYLGMMYQPEGKNVDINKGLYESRLMMLDIIRNTGMAVSDELLYPEYYDYTDDLVSYYFVGARSSENPEHRNVSSGLDVIVGMKNSTGGNLISLAGSVHAASTPKEFLLKGKQVKTAGNPYAHAVLRGFVDESGVFHPNYSESSLRSYEMLCDDYGVENKFVLVDCSHANSSKQTYKQIAAAKSVVAASNRLVGGIMLESYLFEGRAEEGFGISRTDSCIGWEDTEMLLTEIYGTLSR